LRNFEVGGGLILTDRHLGSYTGLPSRDVQSDRKRWMIKQTYSSKLTSGVLNCTDNWENNA